MKIKSINRTAALALAFAGLTLNQGFGNPRNFCEDAKKENLTLWEVSSSLDLIPLEGAPSKDAYYVVQVIRPLSYDTIKRIMGNKMVIWLSFGPNVLAHEQVSSISEALKANSTLTELDLRGQWHR